MFGPYIPKDDLEDLEQLTEGLLNAIQNILRDQQADIAVSALISASLSCIIGQCDSVKEIIFYREIIDALFIKTIQESNPKQF
jgi:hypothetical protein